MDAYKVHNESILRIITNYPQVVDDIVQGLPNAQKWHESQRPDKSVYFVWIKCPNEEITSALGHFLRTVDLDELLDDDSN